MIHAYPLMLDVCRCPSVVIGGGGVAVRKVKALLDAGATAVRVVAPVFHTEMPAGVQRLAATYATHHLDGARLVFAATDSPEVNERVARDAADRGIWVNRSDAGEQGDFSTPARLQNGDIIVTVSAGSAALSAAIRDDLAAKLDPRHVKLAEAMKTLRPVVRSAEPDARQRAAIFRDLTSSDALDVLVTDGSDGLRQWITARYPNLKFR